MDTNEPKHPPTIAELKLFMNECMRYFDRPKVSVPQTNRRQMLTLYGPCVQVIRVNRSVAILNERNHHIEVRVLARSALEYAATAQYAYLRVDGIDRLRKGAAIHQRELMERMAKWTDDPEYLRMVDDVHIPETAKAMPSVADVFRALDPEGKVFESAYALLSQSTHVRASSLTQYFKQNGDFVGLNPGVEEDPFEHFTMTSLAIATMAVTWIMARISIDEKMLEWLDQQSDALGLPVRYDQDWPEAQRAHNDL